MVETKYLAGKGANIYTKELVDLVNTTGVDWTPEALPRRIRKLE